ncbi:MAG: hypothetical protein IJ733_02320 [Lachnospiraceae bacterium]|nr:hypothetical protein [Lachnospiraceae bacterium]
MTMDYDKLRRKFAEDREFAESFCKMSIEMDGCRIDEVKTGPRLPFEIEAKDPELLIAYMKGHDNKKDRDFEYVLYEECEEVGLLQRFYVACLWGRYNPVTDEDFDNLPNIWGVGFVSKEESATPIFHVRPMCEAEGMEPFEVDTGEKSNLININVDSDIMKLVKQAL